MTRPTVLLCILLAIDPFVATCERSPVRYARTVHSQLTPPTGKSQAMEVESTATGLTARWTVETSWMWDRYSAWAAMKLRPDFQPDHHDAGTATFHRALEGDSYTVVISPQTGTSTTFVITFMARPF